MMRIAASLALAASLAVHAADPAPDTVPMNRGPVSDPAPDTVLVKRGDTVVTAGDFLANLEKISPPERYTFRADVNRISSSVSSIFVMRSLAEQARAAGLDKDPDVQRRIKLAEEAVLSQVYMAQFEKSIATPDYEARALEIYKSSPERFQRPERVKVRRVVATRQGRTEEEAKRWAQEALDKLKSGEQVGRVVREYSNDPATRNTDGVVQGAYNLFDDEVAAVLKTAPLNTPIGPIRTGHSYEDVIVLERTPAYTVPFEKVKQQLIENEQSKFRKEAIDKKLATVTQSKDIQIYTDAIASLQTEIDRERIHEMHLDKARQDEEEKARRLQEAGKGKGG